MGKKEFNVGATALLIHAFLAGATFAGGEPDALGELEVPRADLSDYVQNEAAALILGKALFWDAQVGSDGQQACASCHFQAGVDARFINQLNPGSDGVFQFGSAGMTLSPDDFPITTPDVVGSQGLPRTDFVGVILGSAVDSGIPISDPLFANVRRTTGRQAPTAINAVFNEVQFWDGRAVGTFNGASPGGAGDASARVLEIQAGGVVQKTIRIANASLASQATGPPLSGTEMSFDGRSWPDLGKKMLSLRPLAGQEVHVDDSVLRDHLGAGGDGLDYDTYKDLVRQAFKSKWWDSDAVVSEAKDVISPSGVPSGLDEFSVMEANFSLFWGLSVMLYEATLVSDQAPYDLYKSGNDNALTTTQKLGLDLFTGEARCIHCHDGPTFAEGFENVGLRPISEDGGRGEGEFKTPTLRNVELSGPYFHNGNKGTLRQVVEFYNRGGDFPNDETDSQIRDLELSSSEMDAVVDFLIALTDPRVRNEMAPFDHPELDIPNGPHLAAVGSIGGSSLEPFLSVGGLNVHRRKTPIFAGNTPVQAAITENYPNPFNPSTSIRYGIPKSGRVQLTVFDGRGRLVRRLVNRHLSAGEYAVNWDGRNERGSQVEAGIFFVKMLAGGFSSSHKLVLVK